MTLESSEIYRAKWTQAARDAYRKEHPENFAGPDGTYPIRDASDVEDAWDLAGHAGDPAAVRAKIKEIAKRLGLEHGLPDTAKEDDESSERTITPDTSLDPPKDNMPTTETQDPTERTIPAPDVLYYAPITRIDHDKREVIGTATAERKDAHRTVIGYEASKEAFARWAGNIREMHDPKRAVGRALEITPDPEHKRIIVRATISKGAEDTWQKVLDGTLTGFSIGGRNGVWTEREIDGETLPYLERYDAVELSLVDNPSCPGCKVEVVRADGIISDVLARDDETPEMARNESNIERAGATISAATRDGMHAVRDQLHGAHKQAAANCSCPECQAHLGLLHEIDSVGDGDNDTDDRAQIAEIVRSEIAKALNTQLGPVIQRVNALLAHDAGRVNPDFTRNFTDLDTKHDALTSKLEAIEAIMQRIADQPSSGGPRLHAADKRIATQSADAAASDADIMRRAIELGMSPPSDPQQAVKAAAALVRPIYR